MKRKKKSTLIKKADKLFSLLIREKGYCDWCGKSDGKLDCAHIVPRGNKTLRWNPINALPLCYRCHKWKWHSDPLAAMEWFKTKYPERYIYLQETRYKKTKVTINHLTEVIDNLEKRNLKNLMTA